MPTTTPFEDFINAFKSLNILQGLPLTTGYPEGEDSDSFNDNQICLVLYDGLALGDYPAGVDMVQCNVYHKDYNDAYRVAWNIYSKLKLSKRISSGNSMFHSFNPKQRPFFLRVTGSGLSHWVFNFAVINTNAQGV